MGSNVKDIDRGWSKLARKLEAMEPLEDSVAVGVIEKKTKRKKGEVTNAELATFHEFGTKKDGRTHIPASPFFRPALEEAEPEIKRLYTELGKRIHNPLDNFNTTQFLKILGMFVANKVQQFIRDGKAQPVGGQYRFSGFTGKNVGGKTRLIDTAQMVNSITHELRKSKDSPGEGTQIL